MLTINGIKYDLNQLEKDGEKVIIKSGTDNSSETAFFKDVNEDKHVVVEFEKIPAKVIVEYKDAYTKENIDKIDTKIINGFVNDDYNGYNLSYFVVRYMLESMSYEDILSTIKESKKVKLLGQNILNDAIQYYSKKFELSPSSKKLWYTCYRN